MQRHVDGKLQVELGLKRQRTTTLSVLWCSPKCLLT